MRNFIIKLLLIVIASTAIKFGYAQNSSDSSKGPHAEHSIEVLLGMSIEELLNLELETGSFLNLDLQSSLVSMTIISSKQIEASGARHLSEVLEIYVPGFQYLINKWNGIIWGMRGVSTDRNTKFIFLVNGHKMNTESKDGANTELTLGLLDDIERIEVLRGPSGLVYGSGAIAGVINVVTKESAKNSVAISSKISAWDKDAIGYEVQGSGSVKLTKDANVKLDLGYRQSDGIGLDRSVVWGKPSWPYTTGHYLDEYKKNGVPVWLSAQSSPSDYKTGLDIHYKKLRIYSRYTNQMTNAGGWFYERERAESYRRQYVIKNLSNQAVYNLPLGKNELLFRAGFDANSNQTIIKPADSMELTIPLTISAFGEKRYNIGATYQYTSKKDFQFAAGYEYRFYDIGKGLDGKNEWNENPLQPVISDVNYNYHSVFAEGVYAVNKKLSAHFGLRYDVHTRTIQHNGVLNPKIGCEYKLNKNHSVKIIFQQSANNGSADSYELTHTSIRPDGVRMESYHYTNPTRQNPWEIVPGSPREVLDRLRPEKSKSLELITYHQLSKNLIVVPSVSYNRINDLFVWINSMSRMMNAGNYSFINLDLDVQYSARKITLGANHTMQQLIGMDIAEQEYYEIIPKFNGYTSEEVDGVTFYTPKASDKTDTLFFNPIRDVITVDGTNFLNLNTHISKLYVDVRPIKWLTCHASTRVFWGLQGRTEIHEFDEQAHLEAIESGTESETDRLLEDYSKDLADIDDFNFFDIHKKASVKLNLGIIIGNKGFPLKASLHVYDVLAGNGSGSNIHKIRPGNLTDPEALDLYGVDYRSYAFKLTYKL